MSESPAFRQKYREGLISAISAGFFFVLIGAIFVATPSLFDSIVEFFRNFDLIPVPQTPVFLPAPANPDNHMVVYTAVGYFCLMWGIFQISIFVLRLIIPSPYSKKAETVSNMVYWLGAYYLVITFLNATTTVTAWFTFWSTIIILLGLSLIVRAVILAVRR